MRGMFLGILIGAILGGATLVVGEAAIPAPGYCYWGPTGCISRLEATAASMAFVGWIIGIWSSVAR